LAIKLPIEKLLARMDKQLGAEPRPCNFGSRKASLEEEVRKCNI